MRDVIIVMVFIAVFFFLIGFALGVNSERKGHHKFIQENEKQLRCNHHCKIIAVPAEEMNKE